ncbi:hypothetical protein Pelo_1928 [Pelomyxa schiedti]|nr:hypothetical protein Pelo_1928 [Pelomyxa schiedti]
MSAFSASSSNDLERSLEHSANDIAARHGKVKKRRPLVLRVLLSISFIVLLIAVTVAVVPSVTIWVIGAHGLAVLQSKTMVDAIRTSSFNIKSPIETNLDICEKQMLSAVEYCNARIARRRADISGDYVPLSLAVNESSSYNTLLDVYGGFMEVVGIFTTDGTMVITASNTIGFPMEILQTGYGEDASLILFVYLPDEYQPDWSTASPFVWEPFLPHATLSDEEWSSLRPNSLLWGAFSVPSNVQELIAPLYAPLLLPGSSTISGIFSASINAADFISLFGHKDQPGIICTFIQNYDGWIISSSCENITFSSLITPVTVNSTIWEIRDSAHLLSKALAKNSSDVVLYYRNGYTAAFLPIESEYGFTAVITVIADSGYFQRTYQEVRTDSKKFIVVSLILAVLLAGTLSVFTLGGQLQVITRIKRISDVSMGADTRNNTKHGKQSESWHFGCCLGKVNIFSRLSEIRHILNKLEWLEGKVQIVVAFVPVISKLVCIHKLSDSAILESSLSRRMGSYLFCDIANFTSLCESVSPNAASKLLELFYGTVERAAKATKYNLLVKRLGDGIFLAWGFQLEVEKQKTTSTPLPALAYAAALRIGESMSTLSETIHGLLSQEAPDWVLSVRIGLTTGPALHGLLKTPTLVNPDVVGAPVCTLPLSSSLPIQQVNLAARCQGVGKLPNIKALGQRELSSPSDRVVCTITTDLATYHANTHLASQFTSKAATPNGETPQVSAQSPPHPQQPQPAWSPPPQQPNKLLIHASKVAAKNLDAYQRHLVEDIPLQGIGKSNLSVTFVTLTTAQQMINQRHKPTPEQQPSTTNL